MAGQLCWLPKFGSNGKLALHLRLEPYHPWKPHTAFPHLCCGDYPIPNGTKGWATSQKLLAAGWTIVPTDRGRESIDAPVSSLISLASNSRFNS